MEWLTDLMNAKSNINWKNKTIGKHKNSLYR